MMYSYLKLPDDTRIAYSNILEDNTILVGVERPVDGGFDSGYCRLPAYTWIDVEGFSQKELTELTELTELIERNSPLIYRLASEVSNDL